ncbi:unnamed protein product [Euphydryas editha]|uniref:FLYWCH-type domain-containing protein n=1 Tax=Euphydryas editha TaxID=104508 RepID=A0AAU9TI56_EUPED|nr:unnamed protein product [Euphydryas editha]
MDTRKILTNVHVVPIPDIGIIEFENGKKRYYLQGHTFYKQGVIHQGLAKEELDLGIWTPKMEPQFVNESMRDKDDDNTNNDETNFGEDDSKLEMTGFDGPTTGDGNITGGGEGGAAGDAQHVLEFVLNKRGQGTSLIYNGHTYVHFNSKTRWYCSRRQKGCKARLRTTNEGVFLENIVSDHNHPPPKLYRSSDGRVHIGVCDKFGPRLCFH